MVCVAPLSKTRHVRRRRSPPAPTCSTSIYAHPQPRIGTARRRRWPCWPRTPTRSCVEQFSATHPHRGGSSNRSSTTPIPVPAAKTSPQSWCRGCFERPRCATRTAPDGCFTSSLTAPAAISDSDGTLMQAARHNNCPLSTLTALAEDLTHPGVARTATKTFTAVAAQRLGLSPPEPVGALP